MSSIPYNYPKYIDDKVSMTNNGHVDASKQINSPASAGSRGLAKTTQFTNDRTQMQMGNSPIAESIIEIRNILNRIDGVNVPVQEDADAMDWSTDKVREFGDDLIKVSKGQVPDDLLDIDDLEDGWADADQASRDQKAETIGGQLISVLIGYLQFSAGQKPSAEDIKGAQEVVNDPEFKKAYHSTESVSQHEDELGRIKEDAGEDEKVVDMLRNIKQHLENHPNMSEHPSLVALDQLADDLESGDKPADYESVNEDISDKGRIALEKAGFDPMKVKEYMAVFNDHGDTSDIDQMNMDKVGLADAMSMVLASHDIENESYEPFPEEDEMTFEDDDAFYEAFGELGFPEDETELFDAEYRGRKVPLNKPMRGDVKKFKVYVKDPKTGNVKKVNFGHGGSSARKAGQKTMKIRKSNPKARKSFRARHNCANPGPKTKARYWSCRKW